MRRGTRDMAFRDARRETIDTSQTLCAHRRLSNGDA